MIGIKEKVRLDRYYRWKKEKPNSKKIKRLEKERRKYRIIGNLVEVL
jgi:hypothetical protein